MNRPTSDIIRQERSRRYRSQRALWGGGAIVLALAITIGILVLLDFGRGVPKFPLLSDKPDTTLRGTVAYVANDNCIHLIDLSGAADRELWCMPQLDPDDAATLGKPMPPQLVWLSGGKLEVTVFRMEKGPGPGLNPGWQKVIDVRTGSVTDTPQSRVPAAPNLATRPTTSPSGEVLSFTSNDETGHITISVTNAAGRKSTLLDVRGPNHYAYRLNSVFWAPDFTSIIADDGRILVVKAGPPPSTRVLTTVGGGNPFGDPNPGHAGFAVTDESWSQMNGD